MKKLNKIKYLFLGLIATLSFVCIGNAAFWNTVIQTVIETPSTYSDSYIPVCCAGNKTYRSIEAAIADVGTPSKATTIYVYPNLTNYDGSRRTVYIKDDITIKNNVTLCLPYSETKYDAGDSWNSETNSDDNTFSIYRSFADSNTETKAIYDSNGNITGYTNMTVGTARTTLVKLNDDKKITIESGGKLQIGGQCGYQNQYNVSGGVNGNYAELRLGNGSQIIAESGATIDCYGYIKQDKENEETDPDDLEMVILEDGATLNTMLTIYDYKGGTRTTNLIGSSVNIMPFYIYDISCLQTKVRMFAGASVYVSARMEVSVIISTMSLNETMQFFGDENAQTCLFKLSSGYIDMEYFPSDDERQTTDIHGTTKVDIYGEVSLDYVYFTKTYYMTITVDSRKYDFPFNHKYELYARKDSIVNASYNVKFLPGSKFVIDEGATFNVSSNSTIKIYERYQYAQSNGSLDGRWYTNGAQKDPAVFINNGTLTGNGCVAGLVQTEVAGATLNSNNFKSRSASVNENPNDKYNSAVANTYDSSYALKAYLSSDTTPTELEYALYNSVGKYWTKKEVSNTATISYGTSEGLTNNATEAGKGATINLSVSTSGSEVKSYSWTVNNDGGTLSANNTQEVTLTINANETTYDVSAVYATVVVTFVDGEPLEIPLNTNSYTRTKQQTSSGGCLIEGTKILTVDGSYVPVENLEKGDMIISYNHLKGKFEKTPVLANAHKGESEKTLVVTELLFTDNVSLNIAHNHALFDLTDNKYVVLDKDNAHEYLGHSFYSYEYGKIELVSTRNYVDTVKVYVPFTANNINCIANGLLTNPGVYAKFLVNIFEFGENMQFNLSARQNDIEMYGLFVYDDLKQYISKTMFDELNLQYLKIGLDKKLYTMEDIFDNLSIYKKYFDCQ